MKRSTGAFPTLLNNQTFQQWLLESNSNKKKEVTINHCLKKAVQFSFFHDDDAARWRQKTQQYAMYNNFNNRSMATQWRSILQHLSSLMARLQSDENGQWLIVYHFPRAQQWRVDYTTTNHRRSQPVHNTNKAIMKAYRLQTEFINFVYNRFYDRPKLITIVIDFP